MSLNDIMGAHIKQLVTRFSQTSLDCKVNTRCLHQKS